MARFSISLLLAGFCGCGETMPEPSPTTTAETVPEVLTESWNAYVRAFIQEDGRVIDYRADAISTSEGQAYAMLRAVWMNDRATFDRTFTWARNNLNSMARNDSLWAWKWGQGADGEWHVLDPAFASDADQDAALALILASAVWDDPVYARHARNMLGNLWDLGTVEAGMHRYLLAGDTLCDGAICRINPSYYAPYAYRVFAVFDTAHPWMRLVDASYHLLNTVSDFSQTRLPSDWVLLDTGSGDILPGTEADGAFSYDAFRVYWRIALDLELSDEPLAQIYLEDSLEWVVSEWNRNGALPAVISRTGEPLADYESLEMLSGLLPAVRFLAPETGRAIADRIAGTYRDGVWSESDSDSYYIQNWAWFGTALDIGYLGPLERARNPAEGLGSAADPRDADPR